ncbi:uncharacterized protein LOC114258434 [Camellia sinensis]|uniref:uncharacterized protein LOC114258434 n=1 Tax=Camellia sinensis TaxID=4442 RepID=UPI001036576D|nr:uncharacterized protein LOC114258434 [Camellia sinensis]
MANRTGEARRRRQRGEELKNRDEDREAWDEHTFGLTCQPVQTMMLDSLKIKDANVGKKQECTYQNQRKIQGRCISSAQIRIVTTLRGEWLLLGVDQISKRADTIMILRETMNL